MTNGQSPMDIEDHVIFTCRPELVSGLPFVVWHLGLAWNIAN